ncbi:hypothetical protein BJ508DRAFT_332808 [Ascobolus immersus RN42]|uniref:Uncharacterized protein n=1 Tax=Ascobolus immersus RN42 TaxID=1160509 RepID=A0A3N4HYA5_ASCIM|nr:hypothetical protein BJ508DRAFT_332808 [Ascobolus immersus RN42]
MSNPNQKTPSQNFNHATVPLPYHGHIQQPPPFVHPMNGIVDWYGRVIPYYAFHWAPHLAPVMYTLSSGMHLAPGTLIGPPMGLYDVAPHLRTPSFASVPAQTIPLHPASTQRLAPVHHPNVPAPFIPAASTQGYLDPNYAIPAAARQPLRQPAPPSPRALRLWPHE